MLADGATGRDPVAPSASTYPSSYWMPPGNDLTLEQWNVIYERDLADLQRCCADHAAPGCIVEPIESRKAWLARTADAHRGAATRR